MKKRLFPALMYILGGGPEEKHSFLINTPLNIIQEWKEVLITFRKCTLNAGNACTSRSILA